MTLVFHPLAERELIAAAKFYETHASGLGADFIREIERTLTDIGVAAAALQKYTLRALERLPLARLLGLKARS